MITLYWKKFKKKLRKMFGAPKRSVSKIPGYSSGSLKARSNKGGRSGRGGTRGRRSDRSKFWVWFWIAGILFGLPLIVGGVWLYMNVIKDLPSISDIEDADFNQTTVITDRNDEVLYKLYEENRDYIDFDQISENFVNAIVATEDQRYRDNPGVDWKGTIRAAITDVRYGKTQGGSTITQQVIKNILLTPEKKITRKLKEIILAIKLVGYIRDDISRSYEDLSAKEVEIKMKEKILELYANYIFLGNNSYGIEIASQTYFGIPAKDLNVLQGAILAGIPQAPSRYDPYTSKSGLMGNFNIGDDSLKNDDETPIEISESIVNEINKRAESTILKASFANKKDDQQFLGYLESLLSAKQTVGGKKYDVKYELGRKDVVLSRMYEEGYINEQQLKESLVSGLDYDFSRNSIQIKAPHFVFMVIEELEKDYDQEVLRTGGLTIKTTLDYDIQKLAEASIKENANHYRTYNAGNAGLLYLDSIDGDILAYVGSKDYNNEEIDGQVDMVKAARQPGSIIKPFVYSLGFMNMKLTLDSPIYDIKFKIGDNEPNNSDGEFWGLTTVSKALAGSRNIPAIKMFMSAGGETAMKKFFTDLGQTDLIVDRDHYGYALSLGAAETPMLEMANAYAHLSAMGRPAEINPVLEVRGADGSILYKKKEKLQEQVIPSGVAYLMWRILSEKENFPEDWRANFTAPGNIPFATKSGTTNVVKGETKLPRDGRLATYTPSKVLIHWAGNTDGSSLRSDAYGGWLNSPTWKSFVKKLSASAYITTETMEEKEVKQASISQISGKLSTVKTPLSLMKKSLGYIHSLPTEYDDHISQIQIDTLCNGRPTELTPENALGIARYIRPVTIMPDQYDQEDVLTWRRSGGAASYSSATGRYFTVTGIAGECKERSEIAELGEISMNLMQPVEGQSLTRTFSVRHQTNSPFVITDMKLFLDDIELTTIKYDTPNQVNDIVNVTIPDVVEDGSYVLKAVIFDEKGYSDSRSVKITLAGAEQDKTPPYLLDDKVKIVKNEDGTHSLVLLFGDDASSIGDGTISVGGAPIFSFKGNVASFTTDKVGQIDYQVYDTSGNKVNGNVIIQAPEAEVEPTPPVEDVVEQAEDIAEPTQPNTGETGESDPVVEDVISPPAEEPEPVQPEEVPAPVDQGLTDEDIAAAVNNLFPNPE